MRNVLFAEKRREDAGDGCYVDRYLVWTPNGLGAYGVLYSPRGAYGASRDYHRPATDDERHNWTRKHEMLARGEDVWDDGVDEAIQLAHRVDLCDYTGVPSICDGSSIVEVITDDDERAFAIAYMMAP